MEGLLGRPERYPLHTKMSGYTIEKYREDDGVNEDAYYCDSFGRIAAVFDGIGGRPDSEYASKLASKVLPKEFAKINPVFNLDSSLEDVKKALEYTNEEVLDLRLPGEDKGPATTVSALKLFDDLDGSIRAVSAHAGDTRLHLIRDGQIAFQTIDHTYPHDFTEGLCLRIQSQIGAAASFDDLDGLAAHHRDSENSIKVQNFLGLPDTEFTITSFEVHNGDIITISSDGITGLGNLSASEFLECFEDPNEHPGHLAEYVVQKSYSRSLDLNHNRRNPDDLTCVVIKIG